MLSSAFYYLRAGDRREAFILNLAEELKLSAYGSYRQSLKRHIYDFLFPEVFLVEEIADINDPATLAFT